MKRLAELDYSILQQCMHCGMCLPTCPTYIETKEERHSPRGRISLMRAIADGELALTKGIGEEMYYCLGCLACTTACPAGVNYAEIFETARAEIERQKILAAPARNFWRSLVVKFLFTRPRLLRLAARFLWLWQVSGGQWLFRTLGLNRLLPRNLRRLEPQAPSVCARFSHQLIRPVEKPSATGVSEKPLRRVAVLTGCVQDILFSEINRATVDVLLANNCEVHTPPVQPCCGSLHAHNGDIDDAARLARRLIDLIPPEKYDAIISNAGGCGSHLRHFDQLLADDSDYAARAKAWSARLRDISEYLVEIDFRRPVSKQGKDLRTITYHESCHLCHGQKISAQPREVLRAVPGVELRECPEAQWCCGSAGIYNITQPRTAAWLQQRKLAHLKSTRAPVIATANPGCHLQIETALHQSGDHSTTVTHPVMLLAQAYREETAA